MFIAICITILAYLMMGKDVKPLLQKIRDIDWKEKFESIKNLIKPYALKVGRTATRPILQFYYVMTDDSTTILDRVMIYGAIVYTISPISLIPSALYRFLGILDEGAALVFVYKKIKDKITPEINNKVDETLENWFGAEYTVVTVPEK